MIDTTARLTALRKLLEREHIDAWVAPTDDAHASEYVAPTDARREFISGFSGSAGTALVLKDKAYLWTDGRYFLQAGEQLDKNWTLMKRGEKDVPLWTDFVAEKLPSGTKVGIDASTVSATDSKDILGKLKAPSKLIPFINQNLIDEIWTDRPARPAEPIFAQDVKRAGQSAQDKIANLRKELKERKAAGIVVSMLDEVAWLFNLRGNDIAYNPVFFAYAFITTDSSTLYVNPSQLSSPIQSYLSDLSVNVKPYDAIATDLQSYSAAYAATADAPLKVLISEQGSWALAEAIGADKFEIVPSPVTLAKAVKNEVELEGFRQCHVRDGAALTAYFAWLEEQLGNGVKLDEVDGADKLEELRSKQALFKGLSFPTISGSGKNGAIIHYGPKRGDCAAIEKEQVYLCDSGAQFEDGTTDVTRTLHFGTPSAEVVRANTLVLKGHIAIDRAVVPKGTTGLKIDILARMHLWRDGQDYNHGTGHGVGSFLNVHEGPASISPRDGSNKVALKAGMVLSNEPGFYKDGEFGIRIENLVIVKEVQLANDFGKKGWLGFECITMAPIQTKLVDPKLLDPEERSWLNSYNATVQSKLAPLLKDDARALKYLEKECNPI